MSDRTGRASTSRPRRWSGGYHRFWSANLCAGFGDGIALVVYPLLAASLTRDPFLVALSVAAARLPWLVASLPVGALLDRVGCVRVMRLVSASRVALLVLLFAVFHLQLVTLWMFYAIIFLLGTCEVAYETAAEILVPQLVDDSAMERAYGTLWTIELGTRNVVAPMVTGVLIGAAFLLPPVVAAAAILISVPLLYGLDVRPAPAVQDGPERPDGSGRREARFAADIEQGVKFVWNSPQLRLLAGATSVLNPVLAMVQATYVLYVRDVLDVGPVGYSLLVGAGGAGGMLGALSSGPITDRMRRGPILTLFFLVGVASYTVLTVTSNAVVVAVFVLLVNFAGTLWNVVARSARQRLTPDDIRGKVTSAIRWLGWGFIPVGALGSGALVTLAGHVVPQPTALRSPMALAAVLIAITGLLVVPRLDVD